MIMTNSTIQFRKATQFKTKPDPNTLKFGKVFTDHMFISDYDIANGWHNDRIVPYEPLTLDPAATIFHYGQSVFEGLKAYRGEDGTIRLFRPEENMIRMNESLERLVMPQIDVERAVESLVELIKIEKDWVPTKEGTSLYIRPFVIATDAFLGISPATKYRFMIILSPVGAYYGDTIQPVDILVEDHFVRAVRGGTGQAKTAGNYASSLKAQELAEAKGFAQVLWLDGIEQKYVEEVGSMNIFFRLKDKVITPKINGSILRGITRKSIIELLKDMDVSVSEEQIAIEDIYQYAANGELLEVFGTGTAAVISPVGALSWKNQEIVINHRQTGELSQQLYHRLTGIQNGRLDDPFHWVKTIRA